MVDQSIPPKNTAKSEPLAVFFGVYTKGHQLSQGSYLCLGIRSFRAERVDSQDELLPQPPYLRTTTTDDPKFTRYRP
jgi:hypothetical protein